jgi:OOP family OmpA-OmpF porin
MISDAVAVETFVSEVLYMEVADVAAEEMRVREIAPNIISVGAGYFHFDSAAVDETAWTRVYDAVVPKLGEKPGATLIIEGHTDSTGSAAYNQQLSERRAKAVRDYFVSKGIAGSQIETLGYGEEMPRVSNTTPEGRAINRRVDIRIAD